MIQKFEKKLLDNLKTDKSQEVPLKNIRQSMGALAYAKGNPLTKTEITLSIDTYFFDVIAGGIVAPGVLPVAIQTSLSVFLFGLTDFYSSYRRMYNIIPLREPWTPITPLFIAWINVGIWPINIIFGNPIIDNLFSRGDMMINYFFDAAPGWFSGTIKINCNNVAYGTFLNSFVSDLITINTIRYRVAVADVLQLVNPLIFGYQTLFGKLSTDSIDPRAYITSVDPQFQIADIPINLPIDKALMLGFQMNVFCQHADMILFVEKVEPLTHKNKY